MSPRAYPTRPLVGIGVAVLRGDAVLLARRGKPPAMGAWSLPGGAQKLGESVESAARRELAEETGLRVGALHLAAYVDSIHRDAAGAVEYHYTILDFAARWEGGEARPGGDITALAWAGFECFDAYDLWAEARRVIAAARALVG